jgi:EmrB/QacA subfamily drug resistance transporter
VLSGLLLAMLLAALDQTIMAPALSSIADDLGGLDQMPAVVTAYLVAATVVMPVYGKLGDRFGRKPLMQAAIAAFVVGAVLGGLATSMPQLIAFRALQGTGGGGLMIGAQALIGELVSPRERGRYLGLIGAAYVVAAVGGPLLGGFFIDQLTWRWIFAIYPPLGVLALAVLTCTLAQPPKPSARPPIDYAGALTLAIAVVGVVLLGQSGNPAFIVVTILGATAWVVTARYAADPILPLRLFRDRAFAIPVAISFLIGFALLGTVTYLPAILQVALGATVTQAGLLVTTLLGGVLVTTVLSGRRITRTGRYKPYPVVGTALAALGLALLATVGAGSGAAVIGGVLLLTGLGVGLVLQVMTLVTQNAVDYRDLGAATASVTFLRQIGAATGVAVVGAVLTWRLTDQVPAAVAFAGALPRVAGLMALLLILAFALAVVLPARPLRTTAYRTETR